jgi:hypothetical protein
MSSTGTSSVQPRVSLAHARPCDLLDARPARNKHIEQ